ncbi:MAG: amidohydrolase family protein [Rubritalea sp.]|uniref:amidohydrolase family protein n=1 Tax=Rubritalea sp. TaxID=2109375 RepID=UPI003242F6C6
MIDSHHHLWNYTTEEFGWIEKDVIRQSFLAQELDSLLQENQVTGAVAVQARTCLDENDFLLAEAAVSQTIKGVVGWVDLKSANVGAQIDHYRSNPLFKGVREITQGAADVDFFSNPAFNQGICEVTARDLTYDVLIFQDQIKAATKFIDQHPNQRFVLDHAAKPEILAEEFPDAWQKGIQAMAERDNLVCKISGLVTEVRDASWDASLMERYFDSLLESFGPQRLMFGSDWPVCLLASDYARWKDCVEQYVAKLSNSEQHAILSETATKYYAL